eukprot:3602091-Pyramimonas_sp.AAC.1
MAMSKQEQEAWINVNIIGPADLRVNDDVGDDCSPDVLDILQSGGSGQSSEQPQRYDIAQTSRGVLPLDIGDADWPVDLSRFRRHLEAEAARQDMKEHRGGVTRIASFCREFNRKGVVVRADPDLHRPLNITLPCRELHPGLCRTLGKDIF